MKLVGFVWVAFAWQAAEAFAPFHYKTRSVSGACVVDRKANSALFSTNTENEDNSSTVCSIPDDVKSLRLIDRPQGARILRDLNLSASDGSTVNLGDKMGPGKSVVVFLRHLG